jgi:hypothetical protein
MPSELDERQLYQESPEPILQPSFEEDMEVHLVERDQKRETLRKKNLANAQRVIQHQYEQLGLNDERLNGWLYQYLAFLEVRSMTEQEFAVEGISKKEVTIHDAVSFLALVDSDSFDRVQNLWAKMVGSGGGSIRNFKMRIGADGKPIPIFHWINRTFAKNADGAEHARYENKESTGYDDTDRGTSMTSKPVALMLADLGVTKTHSRPHVSDDNPYSESQFKTLKYRPEFPDRFGSIEDARAFCQRFFPWYNHDHHHSGIVLLTPDMLHYGMGSQVIEQRQNVLDQAYARNLERFVRAHPKHPPQPTAVWINLPIPTPATEEIRH